MRRILPAAIMLSVSALAVLASGRSDVQGNEWSTIKGRVVWGGKELPKEKWITVTVDQAHCLQANKTAKDGMILDEGLIVNPKNKGIKNVFVYLAEGQKFPIHPDLKTFPKEVVIDQPACGFVPRALAVREGQVWVIKNSAPVQHNTRWLGDMVNNQGGNITIKGGEQAEVKDLKAQRLPLPVECNIHGWMKARLGVFGHPYYAITDDDGKFEIKLAPVGTYKFMVYHEELGYRGGPKFKLGEEHTIKAGTTDLGELPMGK